MFHSFNLWLSSANKARKTLLSPIVIDQQQQQQSSSHNNNTPYNSNLLLFLSNQITKLYFRPTLLLVETNQTIIF